MATVKLGHVRVSVTRIAQIGIGAAYVEAQKAQQPENCPDCADLERRRRRINATRTGRKP